MNVGTAGKVPKRTVLVQTIACHIPKAICYCVGFEAGEHADSTNPVTHRRKRDGVLAHLPARNSVHRPSEHILILNLRPKSKADLIVSWHNPHGPKHYDSQSARKKLTRATRPLTVWISVDVRRSKRLLLNQDSQEEDVWAKAEARVVDDLWHNESFPIFIRKPTFFTGQ